MSVVVKNVGPMQAADTPQKNTKGPASTFGEVGTVTVCHENRQYVFAPNQSMTLELGTAKALIAQDTRLRIADERDGFGGDSIT